MRSSLNLIKLLITLSLWMFFTPKALAYPEMVRHGYPNCVACHISPTGGGVLTDYGRALSKEIMSTFAFKGEERLVYFFKTPKWFAIGGDFRAISFESHSSRATTNTYIPMQRDLEGAVTIKKRLVADATFGFRDP